MTVKKVNGLDNPAFEATNEDSQKSTPNEDAVIQVDDSQEKRAQWGNGMEFLMSCIAMSVGLGNIWRFPFTAYENGGGAFLIPYIIVLIVIGRPLYYMEMALGQFSSRGNVKMFKSLTPALVGIGYGQLLGTICVATYYCSLMALTLFYLINSFTEKLPWSECDPDWEAENAIKNITCISSSTKGDIVFNNSMSSSELWFTREVLKEASSIDDGVGLPDWRLTLCLFASWLTTFVISARGVKSSGKASYFLALFPYVVMAALLVRAATLEGAAEGMLYFIRPQWDQLATAKVWYAAVTQCFFSLNIGFGSIIMYSSYNNFEHNINRDALVVSTLDTFTSLLAGATIFGILGNLAHELNTDVGSVINSGGTGLAFISYPEAIAKFEAVPWLFAILFFVMLFVLGVGSLVALQGCANTVIMDSFPSLKAWQVSAGTAFVGFLAGIVYVTPGGQFILNMVDYFGGTFIIFVLTIAEIILVQWWYGLENFCLDLEFMIKQKVHTYWRITWGLLTPLVLVFIFIYFLATMQRLKYGAADYPDEALACGWVILAVALGQVVMWVIYYLYRNKDEGYPALVSKSFATDKWGPQNSKIHAEWIEFKKQARRKRQKRGDPWLTDKLKMLIGK